MAAVETEAAEEMTMLTFKQKRAFDFIKKCIAETGVAPSYAEIGQHLGLLSKSSIHRIIVCLEQRGAIRRIVNHARAIEVIADKEKDEIASLKEAHELRVAELLQANNAEVERRRAAENKLREHGIAL